jgi:hypothetical protein
VFFQMLAGRVPYERENSVAKLFAHVHDPPPALEGELAELYPMFGPVIARALSKQPCERYLSAGDFARDAAEALHGARYSGPATLVAEGEARPPEAGGEHLTQLAAVEHAAGTAADSTDVGVTLGPDLLQSTPMLAPSRSDEGQPPPGPDDWSRASATRPADQPAQRARTRKRFSWAVGLALAVLVGGAVAAILALSSGGSDTAAGIRFVSAARAVPDNRVTGSGTASVQLDGNVATVTLRTSGLLNGSAHLMHIHAGGQGICPPASAARLHNGHLSISTTDGLKYYGPPVVSLTSRGDTSASSNLDFARYPSTANIRYKRTMTVSAGAAAAIRAGDAVIVVHGIDYNGNGVYDDILDKSELNARLPGEATAPALCGPLFNAQAVAQTAVPMPPSSGRFSASLGAT